MARTNFEELLDAGVHFGHLKRKWNPNMAPYIFMERNGIHIIDLYKTVAKLEEAASAAKQIVKSGKRILFVATKKQAKEIVSQHVSKINMPYVTERWPGGMLTNFATIRKAVRKMSTIDKMKDTEMYKSLSKRERLQIQRERAKLEKMLGSISDLNRLPSAIFVVDINKEHIAVSEAKKLNIPTFAMVDTNSDPTKVDFAIPSNDDASKSIDLVVKIMCKAIEEGLSERKMDKEKQMEENAKAEAAKKAEDEKKRAAVEAEKKEETEATAEKPVEEKTDGAKPKRRRKTVAKQEKVSDKKEETK